MSNSIVMLRLPVSKTFAKHFKIFFGPTINMGLQDIREQDSQYILSVPFFEKPQDLISGGLIGNQGRNLALVQLVPPHLRHHIPVMQKRRNRPA